MPNFGMRELNSHVLDTGFKLFLKLRHEIFKVKVA